MKENTTDDLIRAYLGGNLPPAEQEQLEKIMLDDPELAEQVTLQCAEAAAAELLIASETRQLFQQWQAEKPLPPSVFRSGPLRWAVGMAAALLLVFAVWRVFRPAADVPMPTSPPSSHPSPNVPATPPTPAPQPPIAGAAKNPPAPITKSRPKNHLALAKQHLQDPLPTNLRQAATADSTANIFQKAQHAYAAGNYLKTLDLLAQADAAQQQSATFLMAHALFQLDRFEAAAEQFERLIAQNSRQFRYRSEWGLLICRLADRPYSEAAFQKQLKEMLAQPAHPYFREAKALRDALK